MIFARPTAAQERWLLLASRYPALQGVAHQSGNEGGWKSTTWLGRCLGFLLGLFATGLFAGVLAPFGKPLLVGGLVLLVAAEWLVAQRRVVRSGIEEALYLCGAVAIAVQLLMWADARGPALIVATLASAVLLAGWRLLNPLFTTLAMAGYSLAIALDDTRYFDSTTNMHGAAIFCAALAVGALIAGSREWQRPSHDRMLDGLVVLMPWLACGWWSGTLGWQRNVPTAWSLLALATISLAIYLIVGWKRRQHAPLIGALGLLVCAAYALNRLLVWPMHWQLIAAGGALLAMAAFVERALRGRREGVTSSAIDEPASLDLMQIAGAAHLSPAGTAPPPGMQGEGGEFGGGGASGRF